jgi:hypothetical protein
LLKALLSASALCAFSSVLGATVLINGTPNLSGGCSGTPAGLSPTFRTLISFDDLTLTARNATNAILGSYVVSVPSDGVGAFNGYFAIQESEFTIKSLQISGNGGIDDLQFDKTGAPEPAGLALVGGGLMFLAGLGKYKTRRNCL